MSLLDSEIARIRFELGYTNAVAGAYPYMAGIFASLGDILKKYIDAGATTTSATSVAAVARGAAPAKTTLVLTDVTGFSARQRVCIDVDAQQEDSFVQSVSGSSIVVFTRFAHSGSFPVTVEGGEQIIRDILRRLIAISDPVNGRMERAAGSAGIQQADEVKFFPAARNGQSQSKSRLQETQDYQAYLRNELARSLGVHNLSTGYNGPGGMSGGGGVSEMY